MRIVNLGKLSYVEAQKIEGLVYCGRLWNRWAASPLGNPCRMHVPCAVCNRLHKTKGDTLPCYRAWLYRKVKECDLAVLKALDQLTHDSVLGCWCVDMDDALADGKEVCHCQVIAKACRYLDNLAAAHNEAEAAEACTGSVK
jgi:hypothetical protein